MNTLPVENRLTSQLAEKARHAALIGTRQLIADAQWDALVSLLVASGAVPVANAQVMLDDLAATMRGHAERGHPEWQTHPGELRIHAERLAARAEQLAGGREGSVLR